MASVIVGWVLVGFGLVLYAVALVERFRAQRGGQRPP